MPINSESHMSIQIIWRLFPTLFGVRESSRLNFLADPVICTRETSRHYSQVARILRSEYHPLLQWRNASRIPRVCGLPYSGVGAEASTVA